MEGMMNSGETGDGRGGRWRGGMFLLLAMVERKGSD